MSFEPNRARRVATIMFADMVDYTALSHRDEPLALELLERMQEMIRAALGAHGGREIKTLGDGFLLEFDAPPAAVACAVAIQDRLAGRNRNEPAERRFELRIGLHVGAVEYRHGDVFGDGVNIASRVLAHADPGGICFTREVFETVQGSYRGRIFELGPTALKNIAEALPLYCLLREGERPRARRDRRARRVTLAGAGLVALAVLGGLITVLSVPSRRELVVLPFGTPGLDASLQTFAEGLEETLCAKLIQFREFNRRLNVVPMADVRQGRITSPRAARRQFGADLVLLGSLQNHSNTLRLAWQLWDAASGRNLTNHVLETELTNVYALQDSVADLTARWIGLAIPPDRREALKAGQTTQADAFLAYARGLAKLARHDRLDNLDAAIRELREATYLDTNYALANCALAEACWRMHAATRDDALLEEALQAAGRARRQAPRLVEAMVTLGMIYRGIGRLSEATAELEAALRLEPSNQKAVWELGAVYQRRNDLEKAERILRGALTRQPTWSRYTDLGKFYAGVGRYADAEKAFLRARELTPDNALVLLNLGGVYSLLGRDDEAIRILKHAIATHPLPATHSNLGTILFFRHDFTNAVAEFEKAVQMAPLDPLVWANLGDGYRSGMRAAAPARAAYLRAQTLAEHELAVDARNAELRAVLATCLAGLSDHENALAQIRQARQQEPSNVLIQFLTALVHELAGDRAPALAELEQALAGGYPPAHVLHHPDLDALRLDPGFSRISNRINKSAK